MRCVVPECDHDSSQTTQGVTYHLFPVEPNYRAAWLDALHITDWKLDHSSVVCSSHFQIQDLLRSNSGRCTVRPGAVPVADVQICRICFATNYKLYSMTTYKILAKAYETLTGLLIENEDNLPPYLCSGCALRLLNYARFRTTSLRAHLTMLDIVKKHDYVTVELIHSVARIQTPLSLNENDCNLEKELFEIGNISSCNLASIAHLPGLFKDNGVYDIKLENDDVINQDNIEVENTNNDDTGVKVENNNINQHFLDENDPSNDGTVSLSNLHEVIVDDVVKIENDDEINHDMVCISKLPEDTADDCMKAENNDMRNQNFTTENRPERYMMYTSRLFEDITDNNINADNIRVINHDFLTAEDPTNTDMVHENGLIAEDYSLDNSLSSVETKKAKSNPAALQDDDDQQSDDEFLVHHKLSCDICPYQTNSELQFSSHLKAHAATECFSCNMCSYITLKRQHLTTHFKVHSEEKLYACDICNKSFISTVSLKTHMNIHSNDKPYSCHICNKTYNSKGSLKTHMHIHQDDKPYSCDICGKTFILKRHLKTHMNIHSYEKPYSCDVCNKTFINSSYLTIHLRTHSCFKPYS